MNNITLLIIGVIIGIITSQIFFRTAPVTEDSEAKKDAKPKESGKRQKIYKATDEEKYRAIVATKLQATSLLNKEEKRIYKIISNFISKWNSNKENPKEARELIVLSQVSIGEFIAPSSKQEDWSHDEKTAWFALQGRRADFLIIDKHFTPILVIEHQGSGHFQGDWEARDKTKKTAYGYAGISVAETSVDHLEQPKYVWGMLANKLKHKYNINYESKKANKAQ